MEFSLDPSSSSGLFLHELPFYNFLPCSYLINYRFFIYSFHESHLPKSNSLFISLTIWESYLPNPNPSVVNTNRNLSSHLYLEMMKSTWLMTKRRPSWCSAHTLLQGSQSQHSLQHSVFALPVDQCVDTQQRSSRVDDDPTDIHIDWGSSGSMRHLSTYAGTPELSTPCVGLYCRQCHAGGPRIRNSHPGK